MAQVGFSSSFKRALKKKLKNNPQLEERFWEKVEVFIADPFDGSLRTHKLSGQLKDLWSFSIEYDVRVVFYFEEEDKTVFIDIGSHDEVY